MSSAFNSGISDSYLEGPPRQVPGFDGVQRMVEMLLAESVPGNGNILVHGAGGGLELRHLADAQPNWSYHGVDPSKEMLSLAERTVEQHLCRITLHHGYIDTADQGPFEGATSLLTFHFIPRDERLNTLREIHSRLKRGAPLVIMHISFPQEEPARSRWIRRHVTYGGPHPKTWRNPSRLFPPGSQFSLPRKKNPCSRRPASPISRSSTRDSASAVGSPTPGNTRWQDHQFPSAMPVKQNDVKGSNGVVSTTDGEAVV